MQCPGKISRLTNFPRLWKIKGRVRYPHVNERISAAYARHRAEYIAKVFKVIKEDTVLLSENEKWNKSR